MPTAAEISARILEIEERLAVFAGVKQTTFGDQSTSFDAEGAHKELARLRLELGAVSETRRTFRVAAFDKGV